MAVTAELIVVRHGEAHCNVAGLVGGEATCTGLTARGRHQISRLAVRLRALHDSGPPIDVLYTAPRRRVHESGQILADALDLPLQIDDGLDGPHHGAADGRAWHDVKSEFGGPPAAYPDRPYATGSETWNEYLQRGSAAIAEILDRHAGQRVLVAGHGETIQATHTLLLGLRGGTSARVGFITDHACLTRWEQHRNRLGRSLWMLAAHNDTAHLYGHDA